MLSNASVHRVDVGMCNGHSFLLWAGIGLDAMIINKLEPRPRVEKYVSVPQYFAATVWNAAIWQGMDLRVWADDQRVEGHFLLAVATNIRRYVGGMAVLSPDAYLDDGEMDLWLMSGNNIADGLRHFFDVLAGRHLTSDQARRLPFRSARVESDTAFSLQMDGEPMLAGNVKVLTATIAQSSGSTRPASDRAGGQIKPVCAVRSSASCANLGFTSHYRAAWTPS